MRRRSYIATGTAIGLAFLAGCTGDSGGQPTETTTTPGETTTGNGGGPGDPGLVVTVEPSVDAVTYGDPYSVTTTVENTGAEDDWVEARYEARTEDVGWYPISSWNVYRVDAGAEQTETANLAPPALGEVELGLMSRGDELLTRWDLTVAAPRVAFGATNSFYDGLDATVDLELRDAVQLSIRDQSEDEDLGTRAVEAPVGEQWAVLTVRLDNTSGTDAVDLWQYEDPEDDFWLLANGVQQTQYDDEIWWNDDKFEDRLSEYEVADPRDTDDYFEPPDQLIPGGATEGWMLFTAPEDALPDSMQATMTRDPDSAIEPIGIHWEGA